MESIDFEIRTQELVKREMANWAQVLSGQRCREAHGCIRRLGRRDFGVDNS